MKASGRTVVVITHKPQPRARRPHPRAGRRTRAGVRRARGDPGAAQRRQAGAADARRPAARGVQPHDPRARPSTGSSADGSRGLRLRHHRPTSSNPRRKLPWTPQLTWSPERPSQLWPHRFRGHRGGVRSLRRVRRQGAARQRRHRARAGCGREQHQAGPASGAASCARSSSAILAGDGGPGAVPPRADAGARQCRHAQEADRRGARHGGAAAGRARRRRHAGVPGGASRADRRRRRRRRSAIRRSAS